MNQQRIWAVAYKEWREILRDRLFFTLAFVVPTVLMLMFGYGLSLDVENIPMAVVDQDNTPQSRDYAYAFMGSRYFQYLGHLPGEAAVGPLLANGKLRMALVIPAGFGKQLASGRSAPVQTLMDGTFPSRALVTRGYVDAINSAFNQKQLAGLLAGKMALSQADAAKVVSPVRLEVRYLYNQSVASIWSLAPKLIMVILMMSPPFLTALGVVREKENGSIFNVYASNLSRGEFLVGKLAPYVGISLLNILLLWGLAVVVFGVPFKGSFLFYLLATLVYVLCTTGIGLVVSILVRTQVSAMMVTAIVTMIPAVLYSGVLIPTSSLGHSAQWIAHALPAMYYTNIVVGCFLKGVGWSALWPEVLVLAGYACLLFAVGYTMLSKRPRS